MRTWRLSYYHLQARAGACRGGRPPTDCSVLYSSVADNLISKRKAVKIDGYICIWPYGTENAELNNDHCVLKPRPDQNQDRCIVAKPRPQTASLVSCVSGVGLSLRPSL